MTLQNDQGQENNCNITFTNNTFKAIVVLSDPAYGPNPTAPGGSPSHRLTLEPGSL